MQETFHEAMQLNTPLFSPSPPPPYNFVPKMEMTDPMFQYDCSWLTSFQIGQTK